MSDLSTSIFTTFLASLRSVGTACTMASVGIYLHRRNFIVGEGKRTLALISQQVTIPCFLLTKVVYCNQDWSNKPCPNVMSHMADIWALLLWPVYVVGCGLLVGWLAAKASRTPRRQVRSVLAACAFGNSTGLPITLLTVIHANFPETTELGAVDPTLFLSVYLLLYPVLQWGVGGWLLAPEEEEAVPRKIKSSMEAQHNGADGTDKEDGGVHQDISHPENRTHHSIRDNIRHSLSGSARNVLNNRGMAAFYRNSRRGISDTDGSLYISNTDLVALYQPRSRGRVDGSNVGIQLPVSPEISPEHRKGDDEDEDEEGGGGAPCIEDSPPRPRLPPSSSLRRSLGASPRQLLPPSSGDAPPSMTSPPKHVTYAATPTTSTSSSSPPPVQPRLSESTPLMPSGGPGEFKDDVFKDDVDNDTYHTLDDDTTVATRDEAPLVDTIRAILSRCLQPPVVGALVGLFVAAIPEIRGVFVDLVNRADAAPLEWMFDGLYAVGQAAVPLNMMILGCNLSLSFAAGGGVKSGGAVADGDDDSEDDSVQARLLNKWTMTAIVVGKMVIMPLVGIASCMFLDRYIWDIPDAIDSSFYLVAMIVFITPTANNVMVMVELSGSGSKEGIARVIGWQYAVAPVLLSLSVTLVVGVASTWRYHGHSG